MILHPEDLTIPVERHPMPARDAIGRMQSLRAKQYTLVHQPDHARLAGELVQCLSRPGAPALTDDIVRGIASHDDGWTDFDCGRKKLEWSSAQYSAEGVAVGADGKPLSFLDIKAGDALRAWKGSIENAEAIAPIAALIVSGHFYRLAKLGLSAGHYSTEDTGMVTEFLAKEEKRQERLSRLERRGAAEIGYWTDVLRFCDLLSLYLCAGSEAAVEFPERIGPDGEIIRLQKDGEAYVFSPTLLAGESDFEVPAHTFPGHSKTTLRWKLR
jgi:hypothetical protein